jgi:hypothetical protein
MSETLKFLKIKLIGVVILSTKKSLLKDYIYSLNESTSNSQYDKGDYRQKSCCQFSSRMEKKISIKK